MKKRVKTSIVCVLLLVFFCFWPQFSSSQQPEKSLLLKAMREELNRSMEGLSEKGSPLPYFINYNVTELQRAQITASYGALRRSSIKRSRLLDVEVRVGDYQLDNTHRLRGGMDFMSRFPRPVHIAVEDDLHAVKSALWLETDKKYKAAMERMIQVKTQKTVKVKEEDESADFSNESPEKFIGQVSKIELELAIWEKKLKEYRSSRSPF